MAKSFACPHANKLLEKLTDACAKGQPIFSLPCGDFKNVSVEDIGAILSMTNIWAVSKNTSKLRKLIVKKGKPKPQPTKPQPSKLEPSKPQPSKLEPSKPQPTKVEPKHKDLSGMPALIPCSLEEERYIIEQIALVEISKLGKYPKVFIDLDDD
jgi:hypothetical protein